MNSKQVSVLLEAEYDHLLTALELVKQSLPDDFFEERKRLHFPGDKEVISVAPILQPLYDMAEKMMGHIEALGDDTT